MFSTNRTRYNFTIAALAAASTTSFVINSSAYGSLPPVYSPEDQIARAKLVKQHNLKTAKRNILGPKKSRW